MFGLGGGEILVIVVIALVLFGKEDLPQTLKKMSKGFNEFKKVANDAQRSWNEVRDDVARTIRDATEEDKVPPPPPPIIDAEVAVAPLAEELPAEGIHPEIGVETGTELQLPTAASSTMTAAPALPEIRIPAESVAVFRSAPAELTTQEQSEIQPDLASEKAADKKPEMPIA